MDLMNTSAWNWLHASCRHCEALEKGSRDSASLAEDSRVIDAAPQ
jgi:hypothetical protein